MNVCGWFVRGVVAGAIGLLSVSFWMLYSRQHHLEHMLQERDNAEVMPVQSVVDCPSGVVDAQSATSSQLWRPVQERITDAVAQVFVQVAATDLLQPYMTPNQGVAYGSGFFINADGDFITNAHVVNQAKSVYIQIPSLGKRIIDMEVVGMSPERDLALLRLKPESKEIIDKELGGVSFLPLGDSDLVRRSDEVLALGYPLGQHSLKSTTGVISGHERNRIQISAAINPGSSGGALINTCGQVVGINFAGIVEAQNVGYAIPINDLKVVLDDLYTTKILRKPYLGILFNNATETLVEYLGNPQPGGCYVVEVVNNSVLDKIGVQKGDMIYDIDGHIIDMFGEMSVPWSEDKISIIDYISRISIGQEVNLTVYRRGERKTFVVTFGTSELPAIRKIYPEYEKVDYEVFGGMVVMELTINHIQLLIDQASGLSRYAELKNQANSALVVTHIFPTSQLFRARVLSVGSTINTVNGMKVSTLDEYRQAIKNGMNNKFLSMTSSDNVSRVSDNILIVLKYETILQEEAKLSHDYRYPLSSTTREMLRIAGAQKIIPAA